ELRTDDLFRAGHRFRNELTFVVAIPLNLHGVDGFHLAVRIAFELRRGREIYPRVAAKFRRGFFLAVVQLVDLGPFGPGIIPGALHRRLRQDLDLDQVAATVAHRRADAIGTGITAADDDHILTGGGNEIPVFVAVE